ncbi:S-formylglutathione hydrolase [Silvanigrella paludirubra]|uniref:S-formylglutathione hydrolase n=1 Tax=Silvanigrella paludirubra TaxID=2499159 RepID=A0A6N6VR84_9BACT|nr:S-formylglutathione hydrolase [Silvanigrella paludirubra]KAB8037142.1 S-formylglutathione hydrolase [Silvanigrella paludirubra]
MDQLESIKEFNGYLKRFTHYSKTCNSKMTFSIFLPPKAIHKKVPAIYWLSGLTCSDENARVKSGAQRFAAELGLAIIFPDTSPRGENIPDAKDRYDLGIGAGFYLNATQTPWSKYFQMYNYIVYELPSLIEEYFPILKSFKSITGHSMGGHGALICALKNPQIFRSASAFAPICNPINSQWGKNCFTEYLGNNKSDWYDYDATCLVNNGFKIDNILIDQGLSDDFYHEKQLLPENFIEVCNKMNQPLTFRFQEGYDHSYHFISTFIEDHIKFHASFLNK